MASIQPHTHSFIVKVWLAGPASPVGRPKWCGRVTHVPSGRDQHFRELLELNRFITTYLHQLGIRPTLRWRVRRWVGR